MTEHRMAGELPSLGAEIELAVMDESGATAMVDDHVFDTLARLRAPHGRIHTAGGRHIAVASKAGVTGIDNGFNLLETAHAPIASGPGGIGGGLDRLARAMRADIDELGRALAVHGLAITSLAQHPTAGTGPDLYRRAVAPRAIYGYLAGRRGWRHNVGIDAKAQNGPTTGVGHDTAVDALNLLLAAAPAFIAIFANSPFENGRASGLAETRMTLWPRMLACSRYPADRARTGEPPRWFDSIGDYFAWTFAPGTVMHAVPAGSGGYKGNGALFEAGAGKLGLAGFLGCTAVTARPIGCGDPCEIRPSALHFEFLQWSNFLDFRLRFSFSDTPPGAETLAAALARPELMLPLFRDHCANLYIENRCTGASLADEDLAKRAPLDVQASCMIAPAALQAGLVLAAPGHAADFCRRWSPDRVRRLRHRAIVGGMMPGDRELQRLCEEVVMLAQQHLPAADRRHLAYARWVLDTGLCGARRAVEHRARLGPRGHGPAGLNRLARRREALPPPLLPGCAR